MPLPKSPLRTLPMLMLAGAVTLVILAATVLSGCATGNPQDEAARVQSLAPRTPAELAAAAPARDPAAPPRIALVLGGGGLRGFAHVGVLRALEEAGIRPDLVVGTSAGAVVGAAYAGGLDAAGVEAAARAIELGSLLDWTWSASGLIRGDHIARWVDSVAGQRRIEQLPIRFAAVATDLQTQQAVVLDRGPVGRAVQASAAVPGINVPVAYAGGHLVDGGAASLVPVQVARAMGAGFVIAVDIYCSGTPAASTQALAVVFRVLQSQSCRIAALEMAGADLLIVPAVGSVALGDTTDHQRAIDAGYAAARAALAHRATAVAGGAATASLR